MYARWKSRLRPSTARVIKIGNTSSAYRMLEYRIPDETITRAKVVAHRARLTGRYRQDAAVSASTRTVYAKSADVPRQPWSPRGSATNGPRTSHGTVSWRCQALPALSAANGSPVWTYRYSPKTKKPSGIN